MRQIRLLAVLGVLLVSPLLAAAPRVGEVFPDLTLPNISDRKPVSLSQFRGKKVLLVQFASW